ncbi:MAG: hypothetical protein RDV48_14010 [Candidatus Eremiobacteraeota bacterium]|nr:hypothetical protein [Candidatus Eremiobacteraeota bacterium]
MVSKLDDKTTTLLKLEYPFPLSYPYFSMRNAEEFKTKLDKSIEVLESLVKYLATITLGSLLRGPVTAEHATFLLSFLPRPSLGTWNAVLRETLSAHHTRPEDLFLPEIYHFYFKANKKQSENAKIIDELINERNRLAHGGGPSSPKDCEAKAEEIAPKIEDLLLNLSFLRDYDLLFIRYSKKEGETYHHSVKRCMGAFAQFENRDISTASAENASHMYLYHRERNALLDLHPFVVFSDRFEGASSQEIFFYNSSQDNKASYMNYQSGHSFKDADLYGDIEALTGKLKAFATVKEVRFEEYRKLVVEAWKFGKVSPEDSEKLARRREELKISPEEGVKVEEEVKEELFLRHMEGLIGLLCDDDRKIEASQTIINTGVKTVPCLIKSLDNEKALDEIVAILAKFGNEAIPSLKEALGDEKRKNGARSALKALGNQAIFELLKDLEKEEEIPGTEETLVFFEGQAVAPLIEVIRAREQRAQEGGMKIVSLREDRAWIRAREILRNIGKPAAEVLVTALDDPLIEGTASQLLSDIGSSSYEPLVKALRDEALKGKALAILGTFGPSTVPVLLEEAGKNDGLSALAEEYILRFGKDSLPYLAEALRLGTCTGLVTTLLARFPDESPPLLIPLLSDESLAPTAESLLLQAGAPAVPPLVKSLGDSTRGERVQALLGRFPPSAVLESLLAEIRLKGKSIIDSTSLAGKIESGMRSVLKDLQKSKIFGSVQETLKIRSDSLEEALKGIRDPFTKRAFSLITSMEPATLSELVAYLDDDQLFDFIRLAFVTVGAKGASVIIDAIPRYTEKARDHAVTILSDMGAPVVPLLITALEDGAKKPVAVSALVATGIPAVKEVANALIDDLKRETLQGILREIGPGSVRECLPFLGVPVIGEALDEVFLSMKTEAITATLVECLEVSSSRAHVVNLLRRFGEKATPALIEGLKKEPLTASLMEVLHSVGPAAVPPLFEKVRGESGAVQSFIKNIFSLGQKSTPSSPSRKALVELSASWCDPLITISRDAKNRDLAIPLVAETLVFIMSRRDLAEGPVSLSKIKEYLSASSLTSQVKTALDSLKSYPDQVIAETKAALEV